MMDDPELLELAWTMLLQDWEILVKMCKIAARKGGRHNTWEEAMSEVAEKLPGVLWSYDSTKGRTLRSHVIGNCRWYLFKMFVHAPRKRKRRVQEHIAYTVEYGKTSHCDDHSELEVAEEVQYVLEKLHPAHAGVLRLYYIEGCTYEQIGDLLGFSKATARKRVFEALEVAQGYAACHSIPET